MAVDCTRKTGAMIRGRREAAVSEQGRSVDPEILAFLARGEQAAAISSPIRASHSRTSDVSWARASSRSAIRY